MQFSVQFGLDSSYGLTTWTRPLPPFGQASLLVAGMKANTPYHMRAVVQLSDGTQLIDVDHVFTTGALDPSLPTIAITTSPGKTPQNGLELLALSAGSAKPAIADLNGNVIWSYNFVPDGTVPNPIKLLSNGHFLINFSVGVVDGLNSVVQEVDLTGTVI